MLSSQVCTYAASCRLDTFLNFHKVFIRGGNRDVQCMQALIDCSAMGSCMAPGLPKTLGLADEPA